MRYGAGDDDNTQVGDRRVFKCSSASVHVCTHGLQFSYREPGVLLLGAVRCSQEPNQELCAYSCVFERA